MNQEIINELISEETQQHFALRQRFFYYLNSDLACDFCNKFQSISDLGNKSLLSNKQLQNLLKAIKKDRLISNQPVAALIAASSFQESEPHFEQFFAAYLQIIFLLHRDFEEHQNKIEKLCRFLRLSMTRKKDTVLMHYLIELHHKHGSIEQIIAELSQLIMRSRVSAYNDMRLEDSHLRKLEQILFAYRVVYESLNKVHRSSRQKNKIKHHATDIAFSGDSEDDMLSIHKQLVHVDMPYSPTGANKKPEDLAENRSVEILDNCFQPIIGTAQSAAQQYLKLKASNQTINKNHFNFATNYRKIPTVDYQSLFEHVWKEFHAEDEVEHRAYFAVLLLIMLTGRKINNILDDMGKSPSYRKLIIFYGDNKSRLGFVTKVNLKSVKPDLATHMQSQSQSIILPLPSSLIPFIEKKRDTTLDIATFKRVLKKLSNELFIPFITLDKLSAGLNRALKRDFTDRATADFISGVNVYHSTPLYYISFEKQSVIQAYKLYVESMLNHIDDTHKSAYLNVLEKEKLKIKNSYSGSQKVPQTSIVKKVFDELHNRVIASHANTSMPVHEKFNHYSLWLWHIFLLLTGQRPVVSSPGRLIDMNTELGVMWVSDKERYEKTAGRIVPLCSFLIYAIENYKRYLNSIKIKLSTDSDNMFIISEILKGKRSLIYFFEGNVLKPARPRLVEKKMKSLLPMHLNWTRHTVRSMIQDIWEQDDSMTMTVIDAEFGHELPEQEAWHPYSGFCGGDLRMSYMYYEITAINLDLKQVEVHDRI